MLDSEMLQWWTVPGDDGGVLELRRVSVPVPAAGEVLVKVASAGVNRGELIARPALQSANPTARARPSGIECAGTVAGLGDGVDLAEGDRVMARGVACHAEYALIDAAAVMVVPDAMPLVEAGAVPNVFVTAHDAIVTNAQLEDGETVLISAGSSGVGTAAIQIAGWMGAQHVIATTRRVDKADRLRALGADDVIDTSKDDWEAVFRKRYPQGVDVVIDQVGGAMFPALARSMAVAGRYVGVGRNAGSQTEIDLDLLARNRLHLIGVTFRSRTPAEALACSRSFAEAMLPAFSNGELRPVLDRAFPLDQLRAAHEYMASDQQFGKIVLEN